MSVAILAEAVWGLALGIQFEPSQAWLFTQGDSFVAVPLVSILQVAAILYCWNIATAASIENWTLLFVRFITCLVLLIKQCLLNVNLALGLNPPLERNLLRSPLSRMRGKKRR